MSEKYLKNLLEYLFQDKSGTISITELQTICEQLKVPVEEELLNSLISYCDVDGDDHIDYEEFCKFLNWQNAWLDDLVYHQQTSKEVSQMLPFKANFSLQIPRSLTESHFKTKPKSELGLYKPEFARPKTSAVKYHLTLDAREGGKKKSEHRITRYS